jgi:hypothetical protein
MVLGIFMGLGTGLFGVGDFDTRGIPSGLSEVKPVIGFGDNYG